MSRITIEKPSTQKLNELDIDSWDTWKCEVSKFDWQYSDEEVCYFYEGEVVVEAENERVEIKPGDLVTFPKGLKCTWNILKPVRKVYKFAVYSHNNQ